MERWDGAARNERFLQLEVVQKPDGISTIHLPQAASFQERFEQDEQPLHEPKTQQKDH